LGVVGKHGRGRRRAVKFGGEEQRTIPARGRLLLVRCDSEIGGRPGYCFDFAGRPRVSR
jgi:hypothetical protein